MREISLYAHTPFCVRRCPYCTFYHVPHIDDYETAFVDALTIELAAAARDIGEPFRCPTVFVGGGTPTVMSDASLDKIFDAIAPYSASDVEVTLEANPEDVTRELLAGLRARGVNRLSLGVQSMEGEGLTVLKRCSATVNARAIDLVRDRFDNFSLDVLLGIPGRSLDGLKLTLASLVRYEPAHFSVYCLEPGGAMNENVEEFFDGVDPERSAEEYMHVCESLRASGYSHYEVSNFATPGCESRHNLAYWRGQEYLGIGPGAHSYIGGVRYHNVASIEQYVSPDAGPWSDRRRLDPRDGYERRVEALMLALRTADGVRLDDLDCPASIVDDLVVDGLAHVTGGRLVLTDRGYLLLNEIVLRLSP